MKTGFLIILIITMLPVAINWTFAETSELTVAKVQWIPSSNSCDGSCDIQVIEPDMNLSPDKIEKFKIHIWSDSDTKGISPDLYETSKNSGVFVSTIYFSSNHSTGQRLYTLEGDLVIASYEDHTLPASYDAEKLDILDSIIINKTLTNPDATDTTELSMISYGNQWILIIILMVLILIGMSVGIILGVKFWKKRK